MAAKTKKAAGKKVAKLGRPKKVDSKASAKKIVAGKTKRSPVKRKATKTAAASAGSTTTVRRGRKPGAKVAVAVAVKQAPVKLTESQKALARLERKLITSKAKVDSVQKDIKDQSKLITSKTAEQKVAKRKAGSPRATAAVIRKPGKIRTELKRTRAKLATLRGRLSTEKSTLRDLNKDLIPLQRIVMVDVRMQKREQDEAVKVDAALATLVAKFAAQQRLQLKKKAAKRTKKFLTICRQQQKKIKVDFEKAQQKAAFKAEKAKNAPKKRRRRKAKQKVG